MGACCTKEARGRQGDEKEEEMRSDDITKKDQCVDEHSGKIRSTPESESDAIFLEKAAILRSHNEEINVMS